MTGLGARHGAAIEVRELTVTVSLTGQRTLDAVDLSLAPGTITGIVGESGSGKTTLVRCLLGTTAPGLVATGRVELLGFVSQCPAFGRIAQLSSHDGVQVESQRVVVDNLPGVVESALRTFGFALVAIDDA